MIEKLTLYHYEHQDECCMVRVLPQYQVAEIMGNCALSLPEITKVKKAARSQQAGRFMFIFPELNSDYPLHLAELLGDHVYKAAFILHPEVRGRFKRKVFWELCRDSIWPLLYLEALELVGRFDVSTIRDDEPVNFDFIAVDPSAQNSRPEEIF